MKRNSGFTSFELAVTLAVVASVAALVMPPYLKWLRTYRLKEAATTLKVDIEMAKTRAISENAFVVVQFAVGNYFIFVDNGNGAGGVSEDWILNGDEVLLRNRPLTGGVRIDLANTTFADERTRFNGRGRIANQGIVTLINSQGDQKQLDMNNRFGRISVN
ncbi:MAG: GspH/FimT family protein [Desulfobacterales bacterium]|nr:MAG: GspH/FimT family protein [Desulfobacterales bacterium]